MNLDEKDKDIEHFAIDKKTGIIYGFMVISLIMSLVLLLYLYILNFNKNHLLNKNVLDIKRLNEVVAINLTNASNGLFVVFIIYVFVTACLCFVLGFG
jgi:hypothetical protein